MGIIGAHYSNFQKGAQYMGPGLTAFASWVAICINGTSSRETGVEKYVVQTVRVYAVFNVRTSLNDTMRRSYDKSHTLNRVSLY